MFTNIDKLTDVLVKNRLTANQYYFAYLLFKNRIDLVYKYADRFEKFKIEDLDVLVDRNLIVDTNHEKPNGDYNSYPDRYIITDKLARIFIDETDEAIDEVFEAYPVSIIVEGQQLPAKQANTDKLARIYAKNIGSSMDKHKEVIALIEWGKQHNAIRTGFEKFIYGKGWEYLEALKKENKPKSNVTDL